VGRALQRANTNAQRAGPRCAVRGVATSAEPPKPDPAYRFRRGLVVGEMRCRGKTFLTRQRHLRDGLWLAGVKLSLLVLALPVQTGGNAPASADDEGAGLRMAYWDRPFAKPSECFTETLLCRDANGGLPTWQPAPPLMILTACSSCAEAIDGAVVFVRAALALSQLAAWQVPPASA
jgi:hypothetical protein